MKYYFRGILGILSVVAEIIGTFFLVCFVIIAINAICYNIDLMTSYHRLTGL